MKAIRGIFCLLALATLAACARNQSLIVLLPDADGQVGAIAVRTSKGVTEVDKPYCAVSADDSDKVPGPARPINRQEVESRFDKAMAAEPAQRFRFSKKTLYCHKNSIELIPQSKKEMTEIAAQLIADPPVEIYVIGHADRVGTETYNRQLSHKRALTAQRFLAANGISAKVILISFLGESKPRIDTPDEVEEPLNRRVELVLKNRKKPE